VQDRNRQTAGQRNPTRATLQVKGHGAVASTGSFTPPFEPHRYPISELEEQTGVSARTIRYYIGQGLLAPAYGRGPSATYDRGHLLRLLFIQRLKDQRYTLTQIKEHVSRLTDEEIERMLGMAIETTEDLWRRIILHPDIEIHARVGTENEPDSLVEQAIESIVNYGRSVIEQLERGS
jgi:DNA-binding transcriptional MerR regulator